MVIPGGKSPEKLRLDARVLRFVRDFDTKGKVIAAICHGGQVLASAGIVKNRTMTCVPGIKDDMINAGAHYVDRPAVLDRNLVTSRVPSDLPEFSRLTIETLLNRNSYKFHKQKYDRVILVFVRHTPPGRPLRLDLDSWLP